MNEIAEITSTPQSMQVDVPPEPSIGSVVLDGAAVAWQCRGARGTTMWIQAGTTVPIFLVAPPEGMLPWARLLIEKGPITLVYRAPAQS